MTIETLRLLTLSCSKCKRTAPLTYELATSSPRLIRAFAKKELGWAFKKKKNSYNDICLFCRWGK